MVCNAKPLELTYKSEIFIDYFEVMRIWYRSVSAVSALTRAANGVAHVVKAMKVFNTKHLLAVVAKATKAHDMTFRAGKAKY